MARLRLLNITTAVDTTTTSPPFRFGGKHSYAEQARALVTLVCTGDFGSANGDTVRFEVGAASASGAYVQEKLDPQAVLDHVDSSGEFVSQGPVNVIAAPGLFGRVVFRAPGGNGTSSISVWAVGAIEGSAAGP